MRTAIFTILVITVHFLTGCNNKSNKDQKWDIDNKDQKWYDDTKAAILTQSDVKTDSTKSVFNSDSSYVYCYYYVNGRVFLKKGYSKRILRLEVHYSTDGRFELRREICENGNYSFEGITYMSDFYGLSTWWSCNGRIHRQGIRFRNDDVGNWKVWDEEHNLYIHYSFPYKPYAIDSFPPINVSRR